MNSIREIDETIERISNPFCGILFEFARQQLPPDFPPAHVFHGTLASPVVRRDGRTRTLSDRHPRVTGVAMDELAAKTGLVGEAVERYCGSNIDFSETRTGSADELSASEGVDCILPGRFIGARYADERAGGHGGERVGDTGGLVIDWVPARSWTSGKRVLVPMDTVYVDYRAEDKDVYFPQSSSSGLAAGSTLENAVCGALLELVERDAFMTHWLTGTPPARLGPDDPVHEEIHPELRSLIRGQGCRCDVHELHTGHDLHAVLARITLPGSRFGLSLGASARSERAQAVEKAVLEALFIFLSMAREGFADRSIAKDEVSGPIDHGRYYARLENAEAIAPFFTAAPDAGVREPPAPPGSTLPLAERLRRFLADNDAEAYVVRLTTPDVADLGFEVVKLLVPELHPLTFGAVPDPLDTRRLDRRRSRDAFPWAPKLNTRLHPFA